MSAKVAQPPASTTGFLCMWNGTNDGQDAYIDYQTGQSNVLDPVKVDIKAENLRALASKPTLLKDGYQLHTHRSVVTPEEFSACSEDHMRQTIEDKYFPECEQIIKELTGAKMVVPFIYRYRENNGDPNDVGTDNVVNKRSQKSSSIPIAHCDQDRLTLGHQIRARFGDEFDALAKRHRRYAQVNIWRAIGEPARKWPLAIIDHSAVGDWDYDTHTAQVKAVNDPRAPLRGYKARDAIVKHHPAYRYYYANDMSPDEVLVFSSGDSDARLVAPHTAFWDDNTAEDAPARRSIEVRIWVFFDEIVDGGEDAA